MIIKKQLKIIKIIYRGVFFVVFDPKAILSIYF